MVLGNRIRYFRKAKGLTQLEVAKLLSKSESTIRMWELGKSNPNPETIMHLCSIFEISPDTLFGNDAATRFVDDSEINILRDMPDTVKTDFERFASFCIEVTMHFNEFPPSSVDDVYGYLSQHFDCWFGDSVSEDRRPDYLHALSFVFYGLLTIKDQKERDAFVAMIKNALEDTGHAEKE